MYYINSALFTVGPCKGNKDDNHMEIFHNMVLDIKQFKDEKGIHQPVSLISDFHNKKIVRFYICPLGRLMDNPERRTNYGLLQGNSKKHEIFGISCNFDNLIRTFEACSKCYEHYLMYIETKDWTRTPHNDVCEDCYGYSLTKLLNSGIYKANLVDLPSSDDAPGIYLNHKPGEITNMLLKDA